jgi:hypothetical protein
MAGAFALAMSLGHAATQSISPLDRVSIDQTTPVAQSPDPLLNSARIETPTKFLSGDFRASAIDLTESLHLRLASVSIDLDRDLLQAPQAFGLASLDTPLPRLDQSRLQLSAASLDWDYTDWGSLGLTASNSTSAFGLMGDVNVSPFSPTSFAESIASAGVAARMKLGDGWVTSFSYSAGISQLSLRDSNTPIAGDGGVRSRTYGVAIAKHGLFGERDALGLSVSRRVDDYFGNVSLAGAGLDENINLLSNYRRVSLAGDNHETDLALGYVTTFLNGKVALQANAGYQMNVAGQNGVNSLTVLSRAKINF